MRKLALVFISMAFLSVTAQIPVDPIMMSSAHRSAFTGFNRLNDTSRINNKWQLVTFTGVSSTFALLPGTNATMLSAPIVLQINRRLNNNLYAFAEISAAPSFFNFNSSFLAPGLNKTYGVSSLSRTNFGLYSGVEAGLMYTNDERTFSISGSMHVGRSSYPIYSIDRGSLNRQSAGSLF